MRTSAEIPKTGYWAKVILEALLRDALKEEALKLQG